MEKFSKRFRSSDSRDAHRVAVVNEKMAEEEFGGREALCQTIQLDGEHDVEVVGVVSNARSQFVQDAPRPLFYLPVAQPHGIPARIEPTSLEVQGCAGVVCGSETWHRVGR